jgi:cell division protein FtsX
MNSVLLAAGMISGFSVAVDQTQNIQQTQTLVVTISILGVVYVLQTNVTIGYASTLTAQAGA